MLQRVTNLHWQFIRGDIEECVRKCQRGEYIYALATVTDLQKRFGLLPAYENIRGAIAHLETLLKAIDSDQKRVWDIEWKLKCEDPERIRREIQLNEFDRNSIWRTWVVITIVVFVLLVGFIGIIRTAVVIASLTAVFLVYLGIERFKRRRTVLAKVRATKETFPELQREASSIRLQLAANEEGVRAQVGVFKQALGIS